MLRTEEAVEHLAPAVAGGSVLDATDALAGLAILRHDDALVARLGELVAEPGSARLDGAFSDSFLE